MTTNAAPAAFYLRRVVHLAVVVDDTPADHSLCGMALIGAIDTTADATCPDCRRVVEILAAADAPAATLEPAPARKLRHAAHCARNAGEWVDPCTCTSDLDDDAPVAEVAARTARLTIPARQLRRGDRIVNLTAGRAVTAFDLTAGEHVVDVFPRQADLDAGAHDRYTIAADDLVVVDREVRPDGTPVQPAPRGPLPALLERVWLAGRVHLTRDGAAMLCGVTRGAQSGVPIIAGTPDCARCAAAEQAPRTFRFRREAGEYAVATAGAAYHDVHHLGRVVKIDGAWQALAPAGFALGEQYPTRHAAAQALEAAGLPG